jgi:transglutaminase-like putative cysteine protease
MKRWFDLPSVLRLLALMLVGVSRLTITGWTFHLQIMYAAAIGGLMLGLLLGQSRYPAHWAGVIILGVGLAFIPWLLGLTMSGELSWYERALSLLDRLSRVIVQLIRQQPVRDSILFLTLMSTLFWMLNVHAGYNLVRHANPWQIALPVTLAVLIIHAFDPRHKYGALVLAIYFALLLLLVARLDFLQRHREWQEQGMYIPSEAATGLSQAAFIGALLLVVIAWTAPILAEPIPPAQRTWQTIARPWIAVRDRFGNAFASLRSSPGAPSDYYGQMMSLGVGARFTDDAVMVVQAPASPPVGVRYYWRAWAYDYYYEGQWQSTAPKADPEARLNVPGFGLKRWEADFIFTPAVPISTLYTAPQPITPSRPFNVYANINNDGTADINAYYALSPLAAGDSYVMRASLTEATEADLRSAGSAYPDWIKERYLELPADITPRTIELARSIAEGKDNPYDITQAVTQYLRANIVYAQTVPEPPLDQELVDWFLFDLRRGFCNYYASAEIVMLRSLGIPARMAVGYARGERAFNGGQSEALPETDQTALFQVRQSDAHAWPEVYFPNYGWVEFEPTASQSALLRPAGLTSSSVAFPTPGPVATPTQIGPLENEATPATSSTQSHAANTLASTILTLGTRSLLMVGAVFLVYLVWRKGLQGKPAPILIEAGMRRVGLTPPPAIQVWAARAALLPLERAYQEVNEALIRLGASPSPAHTPRERTAHLGRILPAAHDPAQIILREYHAAVYSPYEGDAAVAQEAAQTIRQLSWRERTRRLWLRLGWRP